MAERTAGPSTSASPPVGMTILGFEAWGGIGVGSAGVQTSEVTIIACKGVPHGQFSIVPRLTSSGQALRDFIVGWKRRTSGAKAPTYSQPFTARLKSGPDTKQSFCADCKASTAQPWHCQR